MHSIQAKPVHRTFTKPDRECPSCSQLILVIIATTGDGVLFSGRYTFQHSKRKILAHFVQFRLFYHKSTHFLVYFLQALIMWRGTKIDKMKYALVYHFLIERDQMRTGCYSRSSQSGWSGRVVCLNTYQVGTKQFGSYMILDICASYEDHFFSHYY